MTRPCNGPAGARRSPGFEVPALACDSHTHAFGPRCRYPLAADRSYTPPENGGEALVRHLDELGLARAVIVTATAYGTDNRATVDAVRAVPARLRGVAVLGDDVSDPDLDAMTDAGICGARINLFRHHGHAYRGGAGLDTLRRLAPRLRERGWHGQIWLHVDDLPDLAPDLLGFGLGLVFDHMGRLHGDESPDRPGFRLLRDLLRDGKAWVKISGADRNSVLGPPYGDVAPIAQALVDANPDRVVWGSDWPHVAYFDRPTPDAGQLLGLLAAWLPDPGQRQRVLVRNPARLYGFPC